MPETPPSPSRTISRTLILLIGIFLILISGIASLGITGYILNQSPNDFTNPTVVIVEPGTSVKVITAKLEENNIVRSKTLLYFAISLLYDSKDIKASTYVFESPLTTTAVAKRLVTGDFGNDLIRFTHIEGERATHIADNAEKQLINFDKETFLKRAIPLEGKLYPDTYYIPKTFTADELVDLMIKTFAAKTEPYQARMDSHPLSNLEILTLASIIEREANSPESMKIVSGILQGRLEAGMPLQADASIEYILDKPLKELTPDDLKVDSPYNTYTNKGLPPTPIGNPGLEAILAVLEPTGTNYVFYITDKFGEFHYATTYDEHLHNIEVYLR